MADLLDFPGEGLVNSRPVSSLRLPSQLEHRLREHLARATPLLDEAFRLREVERNSPLTGEDVDLSGWIGSLDSGHAVSLAVGAAFELASSSDSFSTSYWYIDRIRRDPPSLDLDDVRLLLSFDDLQCTAHYSRASVIGLALDRLEQTLNEHVPGAEVVAAEAADRLSHWNPLQHCNVDSGIRMHVSQLADRAFWLAGRAPYGEGAGPTYVGPVSRVDGFGVAVLDRIGDDVLKWPTGVLDLLSQCVSVKARVPSARWVRRTGEALDAIEDPDGFVRSLLELLVAAKPITFMTDHGRVEWLLQGSQYRQGSDELARGLVLVASLVEGEWRAQVLEAVATRCIALSRGRTIRDTPVTGEKVQFACFEVLGGIPDDAAISALTRLLTKAPNPMTRGKVTQALARQADRTGASVDELVESSVPDFGLSMTGDVLEHFGTRSVRFRLDEIGKVTTEDESPDVGSKPPLLPKEARDFRSELEKSAGSERQRLEELVTSGRELELDEFEERYIRQPLTGWFARRLLWVVEPVLSEPFVGLPVAGGRKFRTPLGTVEVEGAAAVRMWHPMLAPSDALVDLRQLVADDLIAQPFRQAWRETFQVGEVDSLADLASTRFGGVIVRASQLDALAKSRRWRSTYLTDAWDGGQESVGYREFPRWGVRANLSLVTVEESADFAFGLLLAVDRVWFTAGPQESQEPIPLGQVEPIVYSEALRDVSLFATVASVMTDPAWLERFAGSDHFTRVQAASMRASNDIVKRRREILAFVLPLTFEDGSLELLDSQLEIFGRLHRYEIDLLTGNARIVQVKRWLHFGPRDGRGARSPVPGFVAASDEDETLRVILERARLLVRDDRIKNAGLRAQIT